MPSTIEHVIVLMLENRSFDSVLGQLYPAGPNFDGLTGQECNLYNGRPIAVWKSSTLDDAAATTPNPDPGELFTDMTEQLYGGPTTFAPPQMKGFATNYMAQKPTDKAYDPRSVLHYFAAEQLPMLSSLARAFGVCDQWFASAPCQTWPNRFFTHTGTSLGYVNNADFPIPFPAPSIFSRLERLGVSWRVYFHDVPQSLLLGDVWLDAPLHYRFFSQFIVDAHNGSLPSYSFIEPRYFADPILRALPNDEHPPHNVLLGEELIALVYNAVRASPLWQKTLLIITFDEHGGCYDHRPPPRAVSPDGQGTAGFDFTRYGVRVPAVIVSPYVPAASIVRNSTPSSDGSIHPFDHTSILSTLRRAFNLGAPLSKRDAVAPHLMSALSLQLPTNGGPDRLPFKTISSATPVAVAGGRAAPNHMQTNLARMAASLPVRTPALALAQPAPMASRVVPNVAVAGADASMRVRAFLNLVN